jgi:hypothetical protein
MTAKTRIEFVETVGGPENVGAMAGGHIAVRVIQARREAEVLPAVGIAMTWAVLSRSTGGEGCGLFLPVDQVVQLAELLMQAHERILGEQRGG